MGTTLGLPRRYGRAAPGARVLEPGPGERGGHVSTIGALALEGVRPGFSVPGAIDGDTRLFFVEELLAPPLNRGDLVGMATPPIHNLEDMEDAIEAVGACGLFLPTSSPALNPIENCWSQVKARRRALKPRTLPDFLEAVVTAFASLTEHDIREWVRHWGYRVAPT